MPSSNTPERMTEEELQRLDTIAFQIDDSASSAWEDGDEQWAKNETADANIVKKAHALLSDSRTVVLSEEDEFAIRSLLEFAEPHIPPWATIGTAPQLMRLHSACETVQRFLARTTPKQEQESDARA